MYAKQIHLDTTVANPNDCRDPHNWNWKWVNWSAEGTTASLSDENGCDSEDQIR